MCTNSAAACLHLLYKLEHQLGVDLLHYEVSSQVFVSQSLGADEFELLRV